MPRLSCGKEIPIGPDAIQIQIIKSESFENSGVPFIFELLSHHPLNGFLIARPVPVIQPPVSPSVKIIVDKDRFLLSGCGWDVNTQYLLAIFEQGDYVILRQEVDTDFGGVV